MSTNIKGFFTTTILIFFIGLIPMYRGTGIFVFFRFILIICLVVQISMLFHSLFIKGAWKEKSNFGTICFSLIISFLFLETGFMFIPQSHGVGGYVLGDQIWMKKYWNPINSFGFRDIEPNDISSAVLFVGDSFTAGNGLKDIKERYSDIFRDEDLLKDTSKDYQILNLGRNGADTQEEYKLMTEIIEKKKISPEKIIFQYFGNDIEQVAFNEGLFFRGFTPYNNLHPCFRPFVKGSYLVNFIYWIYPHSEGKNYIDFLTQAYKNEDIINQHKKDLQRFIDFSNEKKIELIPIVFPFLTNVRMSHDLYVNEIVNFFESKGVLPINVGTLIENVSIKNRVINSNNAHASKDVNKLIAQELLKRIE